MTTNLLRIVGVRLALAVALAAPLVLAATPPTTYAAPVADDCGQGSGQGQGTGCNGDSNAETNCTGSVFCPLVEFVYRFTAEIVIACIATVGAVLTLAWITGGLQGAIGKLIGVPAFVSGAWDRALGATFFGVMTLFAIGIVDGIVAMSKSSLNPAAIHIPHF